MLFFGIGHNPLLFLPVPSFIHDVRQIPLETSAADNCYTVEVGLFYADGQRVPIHTPDGELYSNDLIPVQP